MRIEEEFIEQCQGDKQYRGVGGLLYGRPRPLQKGDKKKGKDSDPGEEGKKED